MVCRKVHVDRPSWAVSGGQSRRELEGLRRLLRPIIPARAPALLLASGAFEPDESPLPEAVAVPVLGLALTFAQSCHELHTLHTLPSASKISPGGRFGCVSLVVRLGSVGMLL